MSNGVLLVPADDASKLISVNERWTSRVLNDRKKKSLSLKKNRTFTLEFSKSKVKYLPNIYHLEDYESECEEQCEIGL